MDESLDKNYYIFKMHSLILNIIVAWKAKLIYMMLFSLVTY